MIVVFGSINIDLVARAPVIPRPGETVLAPGYETLFGGKGANQAVAAARARRGQDGAVVMAARIGDDAFGRSARDNLRENGVACDFVVAGPEPTGCAFIVVDARGENAITVASGANAALTAADCPHAFGPSDVLVLQMEVPLDAALTVARRARAAGARILWNLAPAPADLAASDLEALLGVTDILIVNEHEALAAAAALGVTEPDAEAATLAIARRGGVQVVLTAGSRGAVAITPDGGRHHAAAPRIEAVDTTGAGDAFMGWLAAELAAGAPLAEALPVACLAASRSCLTVGAQTGMPRRAEIEGVVSKPASRLENR